MVKLSRITTKEWDRYKSIVNDFIDVDAGKQPVTWLRKLDVPEIYGEDSTPTYEQIAIEGLIQYNFIRTWPANKNTVSGELEGENQVLYVSIKQIRELGFVKTTTKDPIGYWDFNWSSDRFIINGKVYKPDGDTQVAQAHETPLLFFVILQREDPTESERLLKIYQGGEPINNTIVNTADGTITPETVSLGYIGYAKGQRIVGIKDDSVVFNQGVAAGRAEIIAEQSDATITPDTVKYGYFGYNGGVRVDGILDAPRPDGKPRVRFISPILQDGEALMETRYPDTGSAITEYPAHWENEWLVPDGWTHTLEELADIRRDYDVGALYKTVDGKTHLFGYAAEPTEFSLTFTITAGNTIRIDWGDGSYDDISAAGSVSHEVVGDFHVTIERLQGTSADAFRITAITPNKILERVYIGVGWSYITNAFSGAYHITEVIIPRTTTTIQVNSLQTNTSLLSVVIAPTSRPGGSNPFRYLRGLKYWVYNPAANITLTTTSLDSAYSIESYIFEEHITGLDGTAIRNTYLLKSATFIGATSLPANMLIDSAILEELILMMTTPPTVGANALPAITSLPQKFTIYVPDDSVELYKQTTNLLDYASRIRPLSEKFY